MTRRPMAVTRRAVDATARAVPFGRGALTLGEAVALDLRASELRERFGHSLAYEIAEVEQRLAIRDDRIDRELLAALVVAAFLRRLSRG